MNNIYILLFTFFSFTTSSFAQDCTIGATVGSTCTLTTDGVLTIPAGGTLTIEVKAWGAGGGSQSAKNKRSGGGGGAYFTNTYSVTGGSTFPIIVGLGALDSSGGNTSFDFDGSGLVIVGGGALGTNLPGLGGTGPGSIPGGDGGTRETGAANLDAGGGGGGSGPGNGNGGNGGVPTDGVGGAAGAPGAASGAGGMGGNDALIGSTTGVDGGFPGGGAGGKGTTVGIEDGAAGGNGQVIVCVTEVLPIELSAFTAKVNDTHILLDWQTNVEVNNYGFEIQRSKDGMLWDEVEFIEGKGTSYELNKYKFTDRTPSYGLNYYRLKQLDFDGGVSFSKVIPVIFNRQIEIISFPNPVDKQLIVESKESSEVIIHIYNTLGKVVYEKTQIMDTKLEIDVSMLQVGNYFLRINDSKTGDILYQKSIFKNNSN